MFVRAKKKSEDRWQIQIVESVRTDGKIQQKIVRNVATAKNQQEVEDFTAVANRMIIQIESERQPLLAFADPADFYAPKTRKKTKGTPADLTINLNSLVEEKRINQGFDAVMRPLFSEFNISVNKPSLNPVIESMVVARAFQPSSKLKTQKILSEHFDLDIPLHYFYESLDYLSDNEMNIKKSIAKKTLDIFNNKVDILFFDVTTLYFESFEADDLRNFGFSKDCKFKEVQVVLAMVTTTYGMPITYKLFPGNKFEGNTLIPVIEELRKDFNISNIFLAADRGMFNKENLAKMDELEIDYVVAAKLKSLPKNLKSEIVEFNSSIKEIKSKDSEISGMKEFIHEDRRLIVTHSSKRAAKDQTDRQRLVDRLMKKVKDGKVPVKDLINNHGTKKYIKVTSKSEATINEDKITHEAKWDGLHGVITNSKLPPETILDRYRQLWQIEEAFRINKNTLKMRPIYHWNETRIRGHIVLCFITYALVKQIQFRLNNSNLKISINDFLEELHRIQGSILVNKHNNKRYKMPSKLTEKSRAILKVFGVNYKTSLSQI